MKNSILGMGVGLLLAAACSNSNNSANEVDQLREEAIAIHDEIMPQVSAFDRNTVKIDSLLANLPTLKTTYPDLDTAKTRTDLTGLKSRLEDATNAMMDWMTEFNVDPQDKSADEAKVYYEAEVKKVKALKQQFDSVSKESTDKLAQF